MSGFDANYVPGWDCHGLPIEWKIEEEYRAKGKDKAAVPINEFRAECRAFARKWVDIQREEFKRLGVVGDWDNPYLTMAYEAEAIIANELLKFAADGQLYRGSKPVMWSVVEHTALAEAEVEYADIEVDTIFVKFPVRGTDMSIVIWTTTPWTIPGNRAISFSSRIAYGIYEVTKAPAENSTKVGEKLIIADKLAEETLKAGRVDEWKRLGDAKLDGLVADHPLKGRGYDFNVPLLDGEHVTDDAGTGFVHTAPSHGADDYNIWVEKNGGPIPTPVNAEGVYTKDAPGFEGGTVIDNYGKWGDANRPHYRGAARGWRLAVIEEEDHQLSPFMAVKEADHLPQYAAMVHLDGEQRPARQGAGSHRSH